MTEPNPELEPDAPDWSNEPASDDLLAEQLQEKGLDMSEVQNPPTAPPATPGTVPGVPPSSPEPASPGVAETTEQQEEQEGRKQPEGEGGEGGEPYDGGEIPRETPDADSPGVPDSETAAEPGNPDDAS